MFRLDARPSRSTRSAAPCVSVFVCLVAAAAVALRARRSSPTVQDWAMHPREQRARRRQRFHWPCRDHSYAHDLQTARETKQFGLGRCTHANAQEQMCRAASPDRSLMIGSVTFARAASVVALRICVARREASQTVGRKQVPSARIYDSNLRHEGRAAQGRFQGSNEEAMIAACGQASDCARGISTDPVRHQPFVLLRVSKGAANLPAKLHAWQRTLWRAVADLTCAALELRDHDRLSLSGSWSTSALRSARSTWPQERSTQSGDLLQSLRRYHHESIHGTE